jgi:hypothetical protein
VSLRISDQLSVPISITAPNQLSLPISITANAAIPVQGCYPESTLASVHLRNKAGEGAGARSGQAATSVTRYASKPVTYVQ